MSSGPDKLRVGVIGVGHLGKEHARVYASLPNVELVGVVDTNEKQGSAVAAKVKTRYYANPAEIIGRVDAVSVAVPTSAHFAVAKDFLERSIAALVEKPITKDVAEAEQLVDIARRSGAVLQVGHIERFNPALMAVLQRPFSPKFIECHRLSPFSFRSTDIGVVMDLMIHDIDIILHLVKSEIRRLDAVGLPIMSEYEDIANARITFESGCVANVTASRISLKKLRKIRVFSEDAYISLDYLTRDAMIYRKSPELKIGKANWKQLALQAAQLLTSFDGNWFGNLFSIERVKMPEHEPLAKEIESFVECARTKSRPIVSGEEGLRALRAAKLITDEIAKSLPAMKAK
jgi:predicted dehydrogenase